MNTSKLFRLTLSAFAGIVLTSISYAQDYNFANKGDYEAPGFSESRSYDSQGVEEVIDPFSGKLKLVVRDLYLPGNGGMDISILRTYNSLQSAYNPQSALYTQPVPPGSVLTGRSVVGLGWDLHMGRVWTHLSNRINASNSPSLCKINNVSSQWNPVLEMADGTRKLLVNDDSTSYSFTSSDFWKAKCLPTSLDTGVGGLILISPEGTTYTFNVRGRPDALGTSVDHKIPYLVTKIEDRNGNTINISYKNTGWVSKHVLIDTITSSDGRTVSFTYLNENALTATLRSITAHGQTVTYNHVNVPTDTTNSYLDSVARPDGSAVSYQYYNASADNGKVGQMSLKSSRDPFGLTTEYTYLRVVFGINGQDAAWVVDTKKTSGTDTTTRNWKYTYAPTSISDKTTVLSNEDCIIYEHIGNQAIPITSNNINQNLWKAGTLVSKEIRNGSISACGTTLFQREEYTWNSLKISDHNDFRKRIGGSNFFAISTETYAPYLAKKKTTRNSTSFTTEYNLPDTYGNIRQIIESQDGVASRTKSFTFKSPSSFSIWLPHMVASSNISGVSGDIIYNYDTKGNLLENNQYGLTTSFSYHTNGDLKTVTKPEYQITNYSDYYRGIARREDHPENLSITRILDGRGNVTCEAKSTFTEAQSTNCSGIVDGIKTIYTYDSMNRITGITTPLATDNNISISHSFSGGQYQNTLTRGNFTTTSIFHPYRNVKRKTYSSGGVTYTINYQYDAYGRQAFVSYPNSTYGDRYAYDVLDRTTRITHTADSTYINYQYLTGNKVSVRDEVANVTTYEYLSYGEPDSSLLMKIVAPESQTTEIFRLKSGLIDYVTQGGYVQNYEYNSYWQLISQSTPEIGVTSYGRDGAGNMTWRRVGSSPVTYFYYDKLNRLKETVYPDRSVSDTITYNVDGQIIEAKNHSGTWTYNYNKNGNLLSESLSRSQIPQINWPEIFSYTYDGNDSLATMDIGARGGIIDYAPDGFGRPTKAGIYATNVIYDTNGKLKEFTLGNGKKNIFTSNARLLPKKTTVLSAAGTVNLEMDYTLDAAANVKSMTSSNSTLNQALTYDGLNRLKTETRSTGDSAITYDALGNIKTKTLGLQNLTFNYDTSSNRLSNVTGSANYSFEYDIYGNMTSNGRNRFEYDSASKLIVEKTNANSIIKSYQYDWKGDKLFTFNGIHPDQATVINNPTTTADGISGKLIRESFYDSQFIQGNWFPILNSEFRYIYLGDTLIARDENYPRAPFLATYYHNDIIGSPIMESNNRDFEYGPEIYSPYGEKTQNNLDTTIGFAGSSYNNNTKLTYMRARHYDAFLGRFLSVDPVGFIEDSPVSFNRYVYANNNPYKYKDPNGKLSIQITEWNRLGPNVNYEIQDSLAWENTKSVGNAVASIFNPLKRLGWFGKAVGTGQDAEEMVNVIPDYVGPLESAKNKDIVAIDTRLAPYFEKLNEMKSKGLTISPELFLDTLQKAIWAEGEKDGSDAHVGNPFRDKFIKVYGTDEAGFVEAAKNNLKKSRGE